MIDVTPIVRKAMEQSAAESMMAAMAPEEAQRRILEHHIAAAHHTAWGREHGYGDVHDYEAFSRAVPVQGYEEFRPWVMRMIAGESDVLWPGMVKRYAQSSGTSGGKSKYIPITERALQHNHYDGAAQAVAHYLVRNPQSRLFSGKSFILGGSYANELDLPRGIKVGDLSATLIDRINPLVNQFYRIPPKRVALLADWSKKLPLLVESSLNQDITNISGVPSWFLTVIKDVMQRAGVDNIHQVWPNLEVFFHGGISFKPYRHQYQQITDPQKMHFVETYNASEGFFAVQDDPDVAAMLLLLDKDIFYEFVPLDQIDEPYPKALRAWEVEAGKTYSLVITSSNGLWRYTPGDTVRIESTRPLRITIAGRTHHYINAFGEELMAYNAETAMAKTCVELGCAVRNYTAAPQFIEGTEEANGYHQWLIEWETPPADVEAFADLLDRNLQQENSDYQAKRQSDLFLKRLQIVEAPRGLFDRWLASTGKLGGQRKVPRLNNDRAIIEAIMKLLP